MIKIPKISVLHNRRKLATAENGKNASVDIMINSGSSHLILATGVNIPVKNWKKGVVVRLIDAVSLNDIIAEQRGRVENICMEMVRDGSFSIANLRERLKQKVKAQSPIDWIRERIEANNIRESTKKQHRVMIKELESSGLFYSWSDFNSQTILVWNERLTEKKLEKSSIYGYNKRLKPYIKKAVLFGFLEKSPYDGIKIERGESDGIKYLTEEERTRIETTCVPKEMTVTRDLFLFQCYTGLAYADMAKFKWSDVIFENGNYYIQDQRQKSGSLYKLMILPQVMDIMQRNGFVLPVISNQAYNRMLKYLGVVCGINKKLTTHLARHTFATWALSSGVRIEVVSKMLAHADIKTTQKYAKVLQEEVSKGFEMLKK